MTGRSRLDMFLGDCWTWLRFSVVIGLMNLLIILMFVMFNVGERLLHETLTNASLIMYGLTAVGIEAGVRRKRLEPLVPRNTSNASRAEKALDATALVIGFVALVYYVAVTFNDALLLERDLATDQFSPTVRLRLSISFAFLGAMYSLVSTIWTTHRVSSLRVGAAA